jgi:hypothetical protein
VLPIQTFSQEGFKIKVDTTTKTFNADLSMLYKWRELQIDNQYYKGIVGIRNNDRKNLMLVEDKLILTENKLILSEDKKKRNRNVVGVLALFIIIRESIGIIKN